VRAADMETWTPKRVENVLCEAIRWARYNAGPTGPSQVRSVFPVYRPTAEERAAEGWDQEEADPEAKPLRPWRPAREVQVLIDALYWPARYAAPGHPVASRVLNIWLRCRVYKGDFRAACDKHGISRATAYRYRDKALAAISTGLARDGVPL